MELIILFLLLCLTFIIECIYASENKKLKDKLNMYLTHNSDLNSRLEAEKRRSVFYKNQIETKEVKK